MKMRLTSIVFILILAASALHGADADPVREKLDNAKAAYAAELEKCRLGIVNTLDKKEETARKAGDKAGVDAAKAERVALDEKGIWPKSTPQLIRSMRAKSRSTMEGAFKTAVRDFTKNKQDDEAAQAEKELAEFKNGEAGEVIATPVASDGVVPVSGKKERGYVIGKIFKGQKITLEYISGKWKGWGGMATASPDTAGGGDRCKLAICAATAEGKTEVIVLVPYGTAAKPFEWVADKDFDDIVLRMNDSDGDYASNPDTGVRYRLKIAKPK